MDHCSSEKPVPQEKQTMFCCDQSAVSVVKIHAPYQVPVAHVLTVESTITTDFVFALDLNFLPYEKTGDHLSKLCLLRY